MRVLVPHDLSSSSIIRGTRAELIDVMNHLDCNVDGTDTTDYDGQLTNEINTLLGISNEHEKKVLFIHFVKVKMVMMIHVMFHQQKIQMVWFAL